MVDLDLKTLESEPLHRAETAMWPTTTKGYVLWALAALAAIILGIIPALWINKWRHGEAVAAPAPAEVATPTPMTADEEIEITPPDEPAAVAAPQADPAPAHTIAPVKATKRTRPERPKSTSRARKQHQPQPQQPTCNVYLHPKGCPR
jgi:hypothetical protein